MPSLQNNRWEVFARRISEGKNQTQAYAEAYGRDPGQSTSAGANLIKRPEVRERVDELNAIRLQIVNTDAYDSALEIARATGEVTPEFIIAELIENAKLAREAGQFAASNKALELLGKQIGMFIEVKATEEGKAKGGSQTSLPLGDVDKLLTALGFEGAVDLKTLQPVPPIKAKAKAKTKGTA